MSCPDFRQTAEDHQTLLILIKQVGCHLRPKTFGSLFDRICRVTSVQIHSQQRRIRLRYMRTYPVENNDWGDFQAHRKAVGLICMGKCENEDEGRDIYRLYEDLEHAYSHTLYDSRLLLFGLNKDGSVLEQSLRGGTSDDLSSRQTDTAGAGKSTDASGVGNGHVTTTSQRASPKRDKSGSAPASPVRTKGQSPSHKEKVLAGVRSPPTSPKLLVGKRSAQNLDSFKAKRPVSPRDAAKTPPKPHVLCYPHEDQCPDLEEVLQDYVASLFWILESKRLDRSYERQEKPLLLMTPYEKRDLHGVDTDTRLYKKRCQGRLRKHLGDLSLLAGLPGEALLHYQTCVDPLKSSSDWMWLGGAYEGISSANIAIAEPKCEVDGFPRNLSFSSFSTKRGKTGVKLNRFKPGSLDRGLSNGVDFEDSRKRNFVAVDEIIDKYREAILNYGKFLNGGAIELETSLKAARFAIKHSKYLAAADFLQNVVFINLPLSDDFKTQRYSVMADLYDELGMHRKGALFKRLAGMQCVALTNPKPAWLQCYNLLLRCLDGYRLSPDPKEMPTDRANGWPLVQMRVLHEIIFTARKMGTPAIAIRHLCFLLHTMFDHLLPAERQELSSILESYTVRCEGAPQSLALDNGTILPPVPFLRFPFVKSFKLEESPPHLRPIRLRSHEEMADSTGSRDLFIYSPLQRNKLANNSEAKWTVGDLCGVVLQLFNPLPYELKIAQLGILSEGSSCEMLPQSLALPAESGPFQAKVTLRPKEAGDLVILGYSTKVLGVKSLCRLRDLPQLPHERLKVKVTPSLPALEVVTSLPKDSSFSSFANSDIVVTSATALVYTGQSLECELKLTNSSSVPVDFITLSVNSKSDQGSVKGLISWNDDNLKAQLPILPRGVACLTLYINSCCDSNSNNCDIRAGCSEFDNVVVICCDNKEDRLSSPQYIESLLKIQYSGGVGLSEQYGRQCAVAMTTEIQPSVVVKNWDILPSTSPSHADLVLELDNRSDHPMKITSENHTLTSIGTHQVERCTVRVQKCSSCQNQSSMSTDEGISLSQSSVSSTHSLHTMGHNGSWQQRLVKEHLQTFVDVRWRMPFEEDTGGRISLDHLELLPDHISVLLDQMTHWDLKVNDSSDTAEKTIHSGCCGEVIKVDWAMESHMDCTVTSLCTSLSVISDSRRSLATYRCEQLHDSVLVCGEDSVSVNELSRGETLSHSCSLVFLSPGVYKIGVRGQGHFESHTHESQGELSHKDDSSQSLDYLSHSPWTLINITEYS